MDNCDLCMIVSFSRANLNCVFIHFLSEIQVGTSSVVYPAAMFAPQLASKGVPVAEFNLEKTPETQKFR